MRRLTGINKRGTMELMKISENWRRVGGYFLYLLIGWGLFRWLFDFSEIIEELWVKPVIWLLPIWLIRARQKDREDWFGGNWIKTVILGIGLGGVYAGMVVWAKAGAGLELSWGVERWQMVGIGLATAIVEQLAVAGFLREGLKKGLESSWGVAVLLGVMFAALHIPIAVSLYGLFGWELILILSLFALTEIGNVLLVEVTGNVMVAVLAAWVMGIWWV